MLDRIIRNFYLLGVILLLSCQTSRTYYVTPKGDNTNTGTSIESPLATIDKALDIIVLEREKGDGEPVTIFLREGTYNIKKTLKLGKELSNVTIKPYKGENVVFNGGVSINIGSIKRNTNTSVLFVDLKAQGITDFGMLRSVGFARPFGASWGEVFINKMPMHLARWPNKGMVPMGKVLDKGSIPRYDDFSNRGGIIKYDSLRINKWAREKNIWMSGYFMWGYADDMIKISNIDTINKTIKTASATLYGFGDGKEWRNWYGVNILAELDAPGEYYVDQDKGELYFIPMDTNIQTLEFSILEDPFFLIQGAKNITIQGINFECARGLGIVMDNTEGVAVSQCEFKNLGSLGVAVGKGIEPFTEYRHEGTGTPKSGIIGSLQQHFYAHTTFNREGGKNNIIKDCKFYQLGAGGVSLGGGNRLTLEKGNNIVENCLFHDVNRIEKSYRPAIHLTGVGNQIRHCEIYNTPSMAIYMYGNDHIIEYNYIHDVVLEAEDQGAFYYGRDPSERGTIVRYNYFENIPDRFSTCAVYHDDGACGLTVFGNVFYRAGKRNILLGGGSDNVFQNNIFIDNKIGIHVDNRLQNWSKAVLEKDGLFEKRLQEVNYSNPPYSVSYPKLKTYLEKADLPTGNIVENNVFINVKNLIDGNLEWLDFKTNNQEIKGDPTFRDWDKQDFTLKTASEVFKRLPDFKRIPFDKIGLYDK
ncbi:right-handed parallel beta-helix repeat-containing protein [Snuella lapsa]|uniref:Right handed beta helix domain-containing protein n=1 Tax=Snuella lapsa TaxID=870481 RepID=A0ABP6WP03_9FLAO